MAYVNLPKKFDPFKVAVAYGKEIGIEFPPSSRGELHPRTLRRVLAPAPRVPHATAVQGRHDCAINRYPYPRVLSYAYPEVRAFYVKIYKQMAAAGTAGFMIDLLRHPPIAGFEPIVTDAFKKKYGIEMESLAKGKGGQDALFEHPKIKEHLEGYLELFLRELRKEVGDDIEISVHSRGPDSFGLRGKEWIKSGLINTIVDGNYYSGNLPRPTIEDTIAAAGVKGHAYAIAEPGDIDPKDWEKTRWHALSRGDPGLHETL